LDNVALKLFATFGLVSGLQITLMKSWFGGVSQICRYCTLRLFKCWILEYREWNKFDHMCIMPSMFQNCLTFIRSLIHSLLLIHHC